MSDDILWIKSRMPGVVTDGSSLVSTGLISCLQNDHAIDLLCLRMTCREEAQAAERSCPFRNVFVAGNRAGFLIDRVLQKTRPLRGSWKSMRRPRAADLAWWRTSWNT